MGRMDRVLVAVALALAAAACRGVRSRECWEPCPTPMAATLADAPPILVAGQPASPPPPPTPPVSPTPPVQVAETPDTDPAHLAILKAVDEVRDEVAKNRGLAWKTKVPAQVLTREQLKARLEEMMKEDFDQKKYDVGVKLMRRLGMLKPDQDPLTIEKKFLEIGVAGFFDPKTKRFYVIEGLSPEAQRPTIVHELTHALDDQYFDLKNRLEAVKDDGDKGFALTCVVEGCAEHARLMYQKDHADVAKLFAEESAKQGPEQIKGLTGVPAFLVLPTLLHYQIGPAFVDAAIGKDYAGGMERLFKDPPTTEEQVLHPKKFTGAVRDLPRKIVWGGDVAKSLGEGWTRVTEATGGELTGELDFSFWLDVHLGSTQGALNFAELAQGHMVVPKARAAAQGWDGIWMDAFEKKGLPLGVTFASAWDTKKDADEAADAVLATLGKQYGATWSAREWTANADGRTVSWKGANGAGMMTVRGDAVVMADGFTPDDLEKVRAVLEKTSFERDPKDMGTDAKEDDPLAGADWKDAKHGIGWKAPADGWSVEAGASPERMTLKRGATTVVVAVDGAGLMSAVTKKMLSMRGRAKGFDPTKDATQSDIAGKTTLVVHYKTEGAEKGSLVSHVLYMIGFDGGAVVAEAEGTDGFDAIAKDTELAMTGFVYKD